MTAPVVFIVFNRPEVTARVFAAIRSAQPSKLLVVCDGPRRQKAGEAEKVQAVRAIVERGVDWPCEVRTNYSEANLGCRHRVASGITWAFEQVEEAIILEDDCLPDPSFFPFCTELLARYRHDQRVLHINGTNLAPARSPGRHGYRFSHYPWIWGWATWRRAWAHFDFTMQHWEEREAVMRGTFASAWEAQYWIAEWNRARKDLERANTWGFPWMFSVRAQGGLTLMPTTNLVRNLGMGDDATHTRNALQHLDFSTAEVNRLGFAPKRCVNRYQDEYFTRRYANAPRGIGADLRSHLRVWRYQKQLRAAP
ncbi:MAG TPA: hypothetical protein VHF69_01315 [Candidatus Synoicihabitans sp.]|nr:hypothetical protein [Candidatus Synoicihabitans sp.]